mmetsp:Transcript_1469/g.4162  ORF Transcript_1469/g.4162 Transcript_1469/m.4162 type:complete len:226 (+) Transcript_1469:148-825(+)
MGKKSKNTAKARAKALRAAVDKRLAPLNALDDCGAGFLAPATLAAGDLAIEFKTEAGADEQACFELLEANMQAMYEASPWGWDATEKRNELASSKARFVVARDADGGVAAFSHFRYEPDDDDEPARATLYVRELQVAEARRGSGVGRRIMSLLQLVGAKLGLDCVLLTVFKSNLGATRFYLERLSYAVDGDDPSQHGDADACFQILSRALPKKVLADANGSAAAA